MMKLDVAVDDAVDVAVAVMDVGVGAGAAGRPASRPVGALPGRLRAWGVAFAAFGLLLAGPAMALDGIDLSEAPEPPAAGECSRLVQIKYPFLSCPTGEIGLAGGDATWENSRQIPIQSEFNEGNGYWGDELNQD